MPTEILAVGTTLANSDDVPVDAGDELVVFLKDATGGIVSATARVNILLKDDDGAYFLAGSMIGSDPEKTSAVLAGGATYRFTRPAGVGSCGVSSG